LELATVAVAKGSGVEEEARAVETAAGLAVEREAAEEADSRADTADSVHPTGHRS